MAKIEYDILIVGGGIAGLSSAHRIVDTALKNDNKIKIAVIEKGKSFGAHSLSGAVSNPRSVKKLFPDYKENGFPTEGVCTNSYLTILGVEKSFNTPITPPDFNKNGYLIISQSIVTSWMASNLAQKVKESANVHVDMFNGFPATKVIYDGDKVVGVKVDDTGTAEKDNCYAKVTIFADKGFLSKDIIKKFNLASSSQTWAVGVKEVWEAEKDYTGKVWHTVGYPVLDGTFGGGFIYGMKNNRLAIGMVIGLDSKNPNIKPPQVLQNLKKHPMIQKMIKGGKIQRYGAALVPEGGYYALPKEFAVDGAMIAGDSLATLDLKGFSGVDKAMESGMTAGDVALEAVIDGDTSAGKLSEYKTRLMDGWVGQELKKSRYFRYAFDKHNDLLSTHLPSFVNNLDASGAFIGGIKTILSAPSAIGTAIKAKRMMEGFYNGDISFEEDHKKNRADHKTKKLKEPESYDKQTTYSTADVVFYAHTNYHEGNEHIDEFDAETCKKCIDKYGTYENDVPCVGDCTAEVHETLEKDGGKTHHMNLENCVQCRTCEIVCPEQNLRVNPALHGSGPDFSGL